MRISVVHSFYRSSQPSGENTVVDLQVSALRRAGHEVQLVAAKTDDLMSSPSYALRSALTVATGVGWNPLTEIRPFSPDVIHVHNLFPNWSARWMADAEFPIVATIHNFRPVCAAGTLFRDGNFCDLCPTQGSHHSVLNSCYRDSRLATIPLAIATRKSRTPPVFEHASAVIFLSERSRRQCHDFGLARKATSHVVPNFAPEPPGVEDAPQGRTGSHERWLFVGRLAPEKGILELILAWPDSKQLSVVGSGPLEADLREAAKGKSISFLGQLSHSDVSGIMRTSVGLVFPSLWQEAAPMVFVEALARGLPTLALQGNSVADQILKTGAGLVISDLNSLPMAMQKFHTSRQRMVLKARKSFDSFFSENAWLSRVTQVYRDVSSV